MNRSQYLKRLCPVAAVLLATLMMAPAVSAKEDPFEHFRKLGVSIPGWLIDPTIPARDGDGRPATPMAETVSYMVMLNVAKSGTPASCEILMSNGPADFGSGLCSESMLMRFTPARKRFRKTFWIHVHTDPKTLDRHMQIGPDIRTRQP